MADIQRRLEAGRDVSDILPDRHRDLAPTKVDANSGYLTWSEAKQQSIDEEYEYIASMQRSEYRLGG